jgi:hypothetical protein
MAEIMQKGHISASAVRRKDGSVFSVEFNARGLPDGRIMAIV